VEDSRTTQVDGDVDRHSTDYNEPLLHNFETAEPQRRNNKDNTEVANNVKKRTA